LCEIKAKSKYLDVIKHVIRNKKNLNEYKWMKERLYNYITKEKNTKYKFLKKNKIILFWSKM